jgi:hypothetical protein
MTKNNRRLKAQEQSMKNEEQVSRTRWDVRVRFGTKLELPIMISRLMEGDDPRGGYAAYVKMRIYKLRVFALAAMSASWFSPSLSCRGS